MPVEEAPPLAGYNFVYSTFEARDSALMTVRSKFGSQTIKVFNLIPGFWIELTPTELREVLSGAVSEGLEFVECDRLAARRIDGNRDGHHNDTDAGFRAEASSLVFLVQCALCFLCVLWV